MNKIIVGLVGPLASGKEVTKKYLIKKYSAKDCKFSTILRDVLNRINIPISRDTLQRVSTVLRANFGEDLLAKGIASDASGLDSDVVVIDGVRRPTDIEHLVKLPNFFLIKIDADPQLRYKRLVERNENEGDNEKTFEQFLKDHESEADSLVPQVMSTAKYSIENNGTLEELYSQIDEIMKKLLNN